MGTNVRSQHILRRIGRVVGILLLAIISTALTLSLGLWVLFQLLIAAGL
ncbi:hypothetical protein [Lysinibacter cavernae]|uniref:Tetrahydromethanopterin S-methyltransferase subunit G n=1 Tax=Lysinibacter cavernae TaxID=1640652 RepID=A0A7X5R117_9MICO|nr:hypothetical protein [Lysinibacter cavernae]NIH53644.1 tetrahydromethanopterin S-methyltransferase subunit G [Lysinibacter cavernae]